MVMTLNQQKALDVYLDSATFENGYKPYTYQQLSDKLKEFDIKVGKSTLQRWASKFNFEKHLENKVQAILVDEADKTPEQKALTRIIKKDLVTVEKNAELISKGYAILEKFLDDTISAFEDGKKVSKDDIKLAKDITLLTTGREDKMLDRLANTGGDTLSSEELKEEFEMIELEIED